MLSAAGGTISNEVMAKVYDGYQKQLKAANALDFDDIITLTVRLFLENPEVLEHYQNRYRYIMVDEYRTPTTPSICWLVYCPAPPTIFAWWGDDDQSIYKFRGATIENIMSFEKQFPGAKVIRLEQNYRCTQTIPGRAANAVIEKQHERKGKTPCGPTMGPGRRSPSTGPMTSWRNQVRGGDHHGWVNEGGKFSDNAILYRMNASVNAIERVFVKSAIPYRIIGG